MSRRLSIAFLGVLLLAAVRPAQAAPAVSLIQIEGVISPVSNRLIEQAIGQVQRQGSQALIVQLDTPGGLERSMRSIVQAMLNSEVPVIVYVSPTGARAASAGVFITMAAHVAAMAPATNIGAAHPVAIGQGQADKTSLEKVTNDAVAFIKSVARERGRNAEWAEQAVRKSVAITEREAVKLNVVDFVAESVPDLLAKADGRTVKTPKGQVVLKTRDATVARIEIGWRDRFLNLITDPNIAYILLMLGMLGLFFELANPGVILPGVIGGISLILAFFALQSLPFNWAGLLLILFGIVLLIAEIKVVSHGVLTIGGVISLLLGSLMLIDAPSPAGAGLRISWTVILPMVATTVGLFLFVVTAGIRAQLLRPATGSEGLIGVEGVARSPLGPEGQVFVGGALWRAVAEGEAIGEGERVKVVGREGLTLRVKKAARS